MKYRMIRKRRRNSTTNYPKRIALLKSRLPRVVVRKSNRGVIAQIVEYSEQGDRIVATAKSAELAKFGWQPRRNVPTAYLTGCLLAKKAGQLKQSDCVLDIGLYKPIKSSVIFAAAKGAIDSGLKILNSIDVDQKRINGSHIAEYASALKNDAAAYKKQFSAYAKAGFAPENIQQAFEKAKKDIAGA